MTLVLASQSPRRRELLASLGVEFTAISVDIDESVLPSDTPHTYVLRLAKEKAEAGRQVSTSLKDVWVLGSDTSVVIDNTILGKPTSKAHFKQMMQLLSGKTHQVLTSIALLNGDECYEDVITTDVTFMDLSHDVIEQYWATKEPTDKAGGYGIQGFASVFVKQISGSYSSVVGLPLHETAKILGKAGLPIWNGALRLSHC